MSGLAVIDIGLNSRVPPTNTARYSGMSGLAVIDIGLISRVPPTNTARYSGMSGLAVIDIGLNSRVPPTNSQWVNVYCVRICTCAVLGTARMCLLPAGHTALLACV